ncbi:Ig-like domain-containing protein [Carboxylicivirga taeanensis]|uniref:Ig-like domain-containing protein n=1 Tax=Carboxylicivirga taeanensis TaxID=1416875 RepID=UPI003F6DAA1B
MRYLYALLFLLVFCGFGSNALGQVFSPVNGATIDGNTPTLTISFGIEDVVTLNEGGFVYVSTTPNGTVHTVALSTGGNGFPPDSKDGRLEVVGNVFSIDLSVTQLNEGVEYMVYIPSGTIMVNDVSYDALSNYKIPGWVFKTGAAILAPEVLTYLPDKGATHVDLDASLSMTFNEPLDTVGMSGTFYIYEDVETNAGVESITIKEKDKVSLSGNTLSIKPSSLKPNMSYYVKMDPNFVKSATTGVVFPGISGKAEWSFSTVPQCSWEGGTDSDWSNASNWKGGKVFEDKAILIVDAQPNGAVLPADIRVKDLIIEYSGALTVPAGVTLTVEEDIYLKSSTINNATLLVRGDISYNSDRLFITQNIASSTNTYHISSPVANAGFADIGTNVRAFQWNNNDLSNLKKWEAAGATLEGGRGYAIRCDAASNLVFTGQMYEAPQVIPVPAGLVSAYSFIGNPFTNSIDWDNVIRSPEVPNMFWLWKNKNGAFTTYNGDAGLFVNPISDVTSASLIPSMHGFYVRTADAYNSGSITLNDDCKAVNEQSYLKLANEAKYPYIKLAGADATHKDEVILAFASTEEAIEKINTAKRFSSALSAPQPCFLAQDDTVCIKGVPNVKGELIIPMTLKVNAAGEHRIERVEVRGLSEQGIEVYLDDLDPEVNTSIDLLRNRTYSFTSTEEGVVSDRFQIRIINPLATSVEENEMQAADIWASGRTVYIEMYNDDVSTVRLYDTAGRLVDSDKEFQRKTSFDLSMSGFYIVQVRSKRGVVNKKILVP